MSLAAMVSNMDCSEEKAGDGWGFHSGSRSLSYPGMKARDMKSARLMAPVMR